MSEIVAEVVPVHHLVKDLHEARFHARFNYNVHSALATWFYRWDTFLAMVAALAASATAFRVFSSNESLSWIWQSVVAVAAIATAVRPVLGLSTLYTKHSELASIYAGLEWRLEKMDLDQARSELASLTTKEPVVKPWCFSWHCSKADQQTRRELRCQLNLD